MRARFVRVDSQGFDVQPTDLLFIECTGMATDSYHGEHALNLYLHWQEATSQKYTTSESAMIFWRP